MSITDELRAGGKHAPVSNTRWFGEEELTAIADRIDAEHVKLRELVRELYEDQCDECDEWKYRDRMRELGVEVDA